MNKALKRKRLTQQLTDLVFIGVFNLIGLANDAVFILRHPPTGSLWLMLFHTLFMLSSSYTVWLCFSTCYTNSSFTTNSAKLTTLIALVVSITVALTALTAICFLR